MHSQLVPKMDRHAPWGPVAWGNATAGPAVKVFAASPKAALLHITREFC